MYKNPERYLAHYYVKGYWLSGKITWSKPYKKENDARAAHWWLISENSDCTHAEIVWK
jgi:hypothetical protein